MTNRFVPEVVGGYDFVSSTQSHDQSDNDESYSYRGRPYRRHKPIALFRSYRTILESNETDLIRSVGAEPDRAQNKLRYIKRTLRSFEAHAAERIERMRAAEATLSAAIVAALLSNRREGGSHE